MTIVVIDIETTGKDRANDQIVELCMQVGIGLGAASHMWRVKPTVAIHPEALAVHGISEKDVADCPAFVDVARLIVSGLAAAEVIVGYNVSFDIDILQAELSRAGLAPLDLQGKHVVDVLRLWHHVEPRTLAAAHEKFCGETLANAHAATVDVAATGRVLEAMLGAFGLTEKSWAELAAIADPFPGRSNWIGPSQHLQWNERGEAVFAFGKHKGTPIRSVEAGFLRWVIDKDFPPHVKDICRAALQPSSRAAPSAPRIPGFEEWLVERYPRTA